MRVKIKSKKSKSPMLILTGAVLYVWHTIYCTYDYGTSISKISLKIGWLACVPHQQEKKRSYSPNVAVQCKIGSVKLCYNAFEYYYNSSKHNG